ncbi:uncharacterized protein LOC133191520 [Saccostrea echinata]|uniref:uncharacterized protein LOC133191520 n=1 Tax=Saccostrea echinata TaxID=191078 RepID=UPI002A82F313|nr:uncharacterized protein LOC133191520 [Saccostrea echinata]
MTNMFNETFKSSSLFLKLSLVPAFIGFLCHLVSFASSYWRLIKSVTTVSPHISFYPQIKHTYCGLWNCFSCFSDDPNCQSAILELEDAIVVTRVFVTIGLFASCGTLSLTLLCLFIREVASRDFVHIAAILASISTGGCVLIGIVVYGTSTNDHEATLLESHSLHWSYFMCIVTFLLYFVNGMLLFLNVLRIKAS